MTIPHWRGNRLLRKTPMILVGEERSRGLTILHIEGPLRVPVNGELRHSVQALLRRGVRRILVNLAGVWYLDAAGIGELVHMYNMTTAACGVLRITEATPRVHELLGHAGLFDLLSASSEQSWSEAVRLACVCPT